MSHFTAIRLDVAGAKRIIIRQCVRKRKVYWTYHVNMRPDGRYISRDEVIETTGSYEIIESYPDDKYLPSYLVWAKSARGAFRHNEWAPDIKSRKGSDMKCRVCGSTLRAAITDLPFKVSDRTIVVVKGLPVEQCEACTEYLIADTVFAKVEKLLLRVDASVELEIIPFAA